MACVATQFGSEKKSRKKADVACTEITETLVEEVGTGKNLKEVISGTSLVKLDNNVENLLNGVNDVANLKLGGK